MAFPSIQAPSYSKFGRQLHKAQTRIPFESGVVQSAARHTQERYSFKLGWYGLPTADLSTLESHFAANQGSTFTWTYPTITGDSLSGTSFTVRYQSDALPEATSSGPGRWELDGLILEEA